MGDILDWAKKEVEIACNKENPDRKENEFDYGCACYASALKAFESLYKEEKKKKKRIEINRFFREPFNNEEESIEYPGWVEISKEEYDDRKARKL